MTSNRPSRWLAPLALLGAVLAVAIIVQSSTGDGDSESDGPSPSAEERREGETSETGTGDRTTARTATTRQRRRYTVRSGDTLAVIAERTGVTVEELLELNPDIDPNSLTVGDRIKLTE